MTGSNSSSIAMNNEKVLTMIMSGFRDRNIKFRDLQSLLDALGMDCRVKGDHFIYTIEGIPDIINIQPDNGMAKPYQVKQIRNIILKYRLSIKG